MNVSMLHGQMYK